MAKTKTKKVKEEVIDFTKPEKITDARPLVGINEIIKIAKKPIKPLAPLDPLYDWRLAPWWEYPEDDDAKPKPEEDKTRVIRTGITKLI